MIRQCWEIVVEEDEDDPAAPSKKKRLVQVNGALVFLFLLQGLSTPNAATPWTAPHTLYRGDKTAFYTLPAPSQNSAQSGNTKYSYRE